jgi:hypothetical protein
VRRARRLANGFNEVARLIGRSMLADRIGQKKDRMSSNEVTIPSVAGKAPSSRNSVAGVALCVSWPSSNPSRITAKLFALSRNNLLPSGCISYAVRAHKMAPAKITTVISQAATHS